MGDNRRFALCGAVHQWAFTSFVPGADDTQIMIPVDTKMTMQNWRQYRRFMSDGIAVLFEGKYFWKIPADVEMDIGPTPTVTPLPAMSRRLSNPVGRRVE
jgi:hypothetical protein